MRRKSQTRERPVSFPFTRVKKQAERLCGVRQLLLKLVKTLKKRPEGISRIFYSRTTSPRSYLTFQLVTVYRTCPLRVG